ncbi:ABC transporter substrate-binding protein [Candidatus Poribacteria bacterium]|nr:ABC transporter substrate-binding protein [Candidatus Poribacteria bacterium]
MFRLSLRPPHFILLLIVAIVIAVGILEGRPSLKDDFNSSKDAEFVSVWDKRLHISYWEKWGSFEREACQAMVDAFNKSQDEIFVHYINTSQVDRKSMLAIIGHDPPDVVGLWANNVPPFAASGGLLQLDDLMKSSGLDKDRYIPNYLKLGTYEDKVYALPTTPSSLGLYYNKKHFREAGLDPEKPPRTTEELDRYADALNIFGKDGRPIRMGFLPTEPGWFNWTWGFYFGGKLFDEEKELITADDPKNIEALLWTKRYAENYGREKLLQFRSGFGNFDSPQNAFIDGKVSMEIQGVWFSNFIRRHNPHIEFGVVPPPIAQGVPGPVTLVDCDVIAIPRGCRNVEAAWKFIQFTQREGLAIICRLQGKNMPIKEPPPSFHIGHPNLEVRIFEELAASPYTFIQPGIQIWNEYSHELEKAFEHIWNWPVPENTLSGLSGNMRQQKVDELCRGEIKKTLQDVKIRMQRQYDNIRQREKLRAKKDMAAF